ncbi:MAG: transposase [Candidatus Kapabacteria bacterium]|jgi:transposase|nr:transposase [Candidatus Kapabacteria bacterium]
MRAKFKDYLQDQIFMFPPSLDDCVPKNHPVRTVNSIIDQLDLIDLYKQYPHLGASSYHPKMLLKALVFAYLNNIYSSREIEEATRSNVYFMWLCGKNTPDHNTINRFRSGRLSVSLEPIFRQIVVFLAEQGILDLKLTYIDGTKIEANSNRYTFVWRKSVLKNKNRLIANLEEIWNFAESVAKEDMKDIEKVDFATVSPEQLHDIVSSIQKALKKNRSTGNTAKLMKMLCSCV